MSTLIDKENILHDLKNTLIAKDKECDVSSRTQVALKEAKDKFKKAWNAKQAELKASRIRKKAAGGGSRKMNDIKFTEFELNQLYDLSA